jgi:2-dehydro-3-deoxyphosphogluconate aldolase/(4S)-4-hydroxy-2-oxoglutarate aldolase
MAGPVTPTMQPALDAQRQVVQRLARTRVLPVLTVTDPQTLEPTCRALLDGGISCVEITCRTPYANEAIARASRIPGLMVGAGTVLEKEQAVTAAAAGARFAVAPGLSEPVLAAARDSGLAFFPGVATPSEIEEARRLGCQVLKVFPVSSLGGTTFLRSISAPYPDVRFIPTGGISDATIGQYLEVPAVLACGASWLCEPDLVAAGRFDEIRRRAGAALSSAG